MIKELITNLFRNQFVRFLFVGGINTLFGYGVFFLFKYFTHSDEIALIFANVLGVAFNFNTIGRLVFKNRDYRVIFKFILVYAVIYAVNLAGLKAFNAFSVNSLIGQAVLTIPIAVLSFLLNKIFVFKA